MPVLKDKCGKPITASCVSVFVNHIKRQMKPRPGSQMFDCMSVSRQHPRTEESFLAGERSSNVTS